MLKSSANFCDPRFVFVFTWIFCWGLLHLMAGVLVEGEAISYNGILYLLFAIIIWVFGCEVGMRSSGLHFRNFVTSPRVGAERQFSFVFLCLVLYFIFRVLDVWVVTGVISLTPMNLGAYRELLTEDGVPQVFGFINILNGLMFSLPCLAVFWWRRVGPNKVYSILLSVSSILFVYLSTARSAIFLSGLVLFFYLAFSGLRVRFILLFPLVLFFAFGLIGSISGKDGDIELFLKYLLGPSLAFDAILNDPKLLEHELLSFRPLHFILLSVGLIKETFHLIDYVNVPFPINVYTVFGVYVNDFGIFGSLVCLFLFAWITALCFRVAMLAKTFSTVMFACFLLAFIVLGVFYDYYTSSGFVYLLPLTAFIFFPNEKIVS